MDDPKAGYWVESMVEKLVGQSVERMVAYLEKMLVEKLDIWRAERKVDNSADWMVA
jgi:hypothetical protein